MVTNASDKSNATNAPDNYPSTLQSNFATQKSNTNYEQSRRTTDIITPRVQKKQSATKLPEELNIELDCEFLSNPIDPNGNATLTTQMRCHEFEDKGVVFLHKGAPNIEGCPYRKSNNPIVDYLKHNGYYFTYHPDSEDSLKQFGLVMNDAQKHLKDTPKLIIHLWCYFGIVDLCKAFMGKEREFLHKVIAGEYDLTIAHDKYLNTNFTYFIDTGEDVIPVPKDYIPTPFSIMNKMVCLQIHDVSAIFGKSSYKDAGFITRTPLPDKGKMDKYKTCMDKAMIERPNEFLEYGLGDLHCKDIFDNWTTMLETLCTELGIKKVEPKYSIGSTVHEIMLGYFIKELGMSEKHLEEYGFNVASPKTLKTNTKDTSQYLCKSDGGRCHNNQPRKVYHKGRVGDIDISGCYATTMESVVYPIGVPVILQYDKKSNTDKENPHNTYYSLGEFLSKFGYLLRDNCWVARASTPQGYKLKHAQDLIPSWYPPKKIDELKCDSDLQGGATFNYDNDGTSKIYKHEIHLGIITSDIVEAIKLYCGQRQRKELLENLYVKTAIIYPATHYVETYDEVKQAHKDFKGENTFDIQQFNGLLTTVQVKQQCHTWTEAPLSKFISHIKSSRAKYSKKKPEELPFNIMYKTVGNTAYGVAVSPYFALGNAVVANNITARARLMAWCVEKSLNTFQTITDGGQFDLDEIITHGKKQVNANNTVEQKGLKQGDIKLTSLDGESPTEVEANAVAHIKGLFPDLTICKNEVYDLELKKVDGEWLAEGIVLHGASDYSLLYSTPHNKMRGWNDGLYTLDGVAHDQVASFFDELRHHPNAVVRLVPTLESYFLKTKEYAKHHLDWNEKNIHLGDRVVKTKLILEFSLGQFTFLSHEQRESWYKALEKLKDERKQAYGQSLEMFYLNDDGTLDYERMVQEAWEDIEAGLIKPRALMDKSRHTHRKYQAHSHLEKRRDLKDYQRNRMNGWHRTE